MRRLLLLAALAYALAFAALLSFEGRVLALALPLLVTLAGALLFGPAPLALRAERALDSARVSEGQPVEVTLTVTNEGGPLEDVLLVEGLPPGVEVSGGDAGRLVSLAPGESAVLRYTLHAGRGHYHFGAVTAVAQDRLAVLQRRATLNAAGVQVAHVLPRVTRLRRIDIRPRQTRAVAGNIPARVGGPGTEFFGVRGYHPTDALRHINWRASARHPGTIYTNEYQQERIADVGVILDARRRTNFEIGPDALFEHSVHAAAALASVFLNASNRVSLLIYGRLLDRTSPGYGKRQRERILQALARAEPGESQVFTHLDYLPTRFFPAQSQIVLVSPLAADDTAALVQMRARGYELLVISPDPVRFEAARLPATDATRLAARIARLERAVLFRQLRRAGVRIVDWDVRAPLEGVMAAALVRGPVATRPPGLLR